ncbi:MAG: AbiH family protein [Niabella sp.]
MNRLILIGNGFDLAHNLKTKYSDFLFSYIKDCFLETEKKRLYEDEFIKIQVRDGRAYNLIKFNINEVTSIKDFERFLNIPSYNLILFGSNSERDSDSYNGRYEPIEKFKLNIKDDFFMHLFKDACILTWVDIEREYYESLKKTLDPKNKNRIEDLKKLNDSFAHLKKLLAVYISTISLGNSYNTEISKHITAPINLKDIPTIKEKEIQEIREKNEANIKAGGWEISPSSIMLLNFNYTDSALQYLPPYEESHNSILNNIHGTSDGNIIFGYGDEMDDNYRQMESENNNEYLKFAKSFGYFNDANYHSLIRFLDSDKYELLIMGHSCGLSDRTLLNMIFEHDNCKSIKTYYHKREDGSNDFAEKTMEISRHFRNKQKMRERILPFDKCTPLPQL